MKVSYPQKLQSNGVASWQLEQATETLRDIIGSTAELAEVTWEIIQDGRGQSLYRLTIRDGDEVVSDSIAPGEFQSPDKLWWRLYRLWGAVLRDRSHKLVAELQKP